MLSGLVAKFHGAVAVSSIFSAIRFTARALVFLDNLFKEVPAEAEGGRSDGSGIFFDIEDSCLSPTLKALITLGFTKAAMVAIKCE